MSSVIEKPSQLYSAIAAALRDAAFGINVGSREGFTDVGDQPWVLIAFDRDAAGSRANGSTVLNYRHSVPRHNPSGRLVYRRIGATRYGVERG